ncbi:MAG: hypothetical protein B7Y25_01675 [Alphaproteobacteria bacterium 16-39-46]|nr:MAG: hypothetical protein B7Y25_01675 [Alphaproteobacteria bacterium 16-39-46]OZA43951.1 MAG: hypothetical protein B7X84_01660 [Alphaproteobacteria bacterium 17-39-52]
MGFSFKRIVCLAFSLIFYSLSVEAGLTEPTKESPKGFQRISLPRKVKHDETGFYYEDERDKAHPVDKKFYRRNKNCSKTPTSVKFTPRDESVEDKGKGFHKRKKDLHPLFYSPQK